jgi:cysteine desulfurase
MRRIYADHAATSPLDPAVAEAMLPWLDAGNPSSLHFEGRRARAAIDEARERVTGALGCAFGELVFTSSGTEAANLALLGTALAHQGGTRDRILIGGAEHHCVLHTLPLLEKFGYRTELLAVDRFARLDREALASALGPDVLLVAAMHANNELGTVNEIGVIAEEVHAAGALLFVDAVQTFRSLPWTVRDLDADLLTVSAHKINGPKGAGGLYVRAGVKPLPLSVGGGQERELRAGTENVAAVVGFGLASTLPRPSASPARDEFEAMLESKVVPSVPSGVERLSGHSHFRLPGVRAESLLILLDRMGVSASAGAACSSGALEPSHVMLACGFSDEEAREGVRFSFGPRTTSTEGREAAARVLEAIERLGPRRTISG